MTPALLVQTCRYAATNFGPAKAGLPAVSGPAAPRWRIKSRPFSRTKRGIRTSPAGSDARKAAQIVKEHWFPLPGQPQQCNDKKYCNNIIMYLSRRIHPEIPGGDTGLIGIKAQMYSQAKRRSGSGSFLIFHNHFSATAQGLKPNVTYFTTKNTGRAFDLYELGLLASGLRLENRALSSCLLI
jgi:hypothetical protein